MANYEVKAIPSYCEQDTWAKFQADGTVLVGITDYAQQMLNEILYLELPDPGAEVRQFEAFGTAESTKSNSDIISPISGTVKEVNNAAIDDPGVLNRDPYDAGWLLLVTPSNAEEERDNLMKAKGYREILETRE